MNVIEMDSLTKFYGPRRGVQDINLSIKGGQVFGFLGPNGSGKSTTMRVLLDFHRPTSGAASMLGLDCQKDSLQIRKRTGYLSGDLSLYDKLNGLELLTWLGDLRGGVPEHRIRSLSDELSLDLDRKIGDLSRGNRQKVGLVQAFMHEPELLILDEPTTGLDPLIQHTFQRMVRDVADSGRAVFLSSHIIDEIDRTCDKVAIIREGFLVAVETIKSLRARSVRTVRIKFDEPVPAAQFHDLDEVHEVQVLGTELNIKTTGDIDSIVKLAAQHHVVDLVSEQADLEEIFLSYYSGESGTTDFRHTGSDDTGSDGDTDFDHTSLGDSTGFDGDTSGAGAS